MLGLPARFAPRVRRAQRGVSGKGQFSAGRENAHPVIRALGFGCGADGQDKSGFAQLRPTRKLLHGLVRQAFAVQHHGHRVAQVGLVGEDINLGEGA